VEIGNLIWIFFIVMMMQPIMSRKMLEYARAQALRNLERSRGTRAIALVHRQETMNLLGFPILRYINVEDSEEILRAIKLTDPETPIDLIVHSPGGLVLASMQIAHALANRKATVTVFVPHFAMSGGTLIALSASRIVMDENAVLGPVDPQVGEYPAASILRVLERKSHDEIDDKTMILADVAEKAIRQLSDGVAGLLSKRMEEGKARSLANLLATGHFTHDYPLTVEELKKLDIPISTDVPEEIYLFMRLFPQPKQVSPSVSYLPIIPGRPSRN
jgi:ClpP class serine protease